MVDRTRLTTSQQVGELDFDFDTLPEALKRIQEAIEIYGPDAKIEECGRPYSESSRYLAITKMLPETDEDMNKRIREAEAWEKRRDEQEAKEFERLKKKFGA